MRSKSLLVSNIFATVYSSILIWTYATPIFIILGSIFTAGKALEIYGAGEVADAFKTLFSLIFSIMDIGASYLTFLYVLIILLFIHIIIFMIATIIGWVAYAQKNHKKANLSAILYLISAVAYPINLFFCLPIIIIGFTGGRNQRKINSSPSVLTEA